VSRNTISHPGLCQQAPDRWADPRQQSTTRRLCMKCPRLERCRRETLTENRTFGMWAGVWIDHDLPAKRHLLQPKSRLRAITPHPHQTTRVGPLPINELSPAAATMVTARSSGHCEILAPACLLDQDLIFTRRTQDCPLPADSPAAALAACTNCAELIEQTDHDTAQRYGYITTTAHPITIWPVYWRQRRWATLNHFGHLIDLPERSPRSPSLRPSA
jgi:Transcription factor WhiB